MGMVLSFVSNLLYTGERCALCVAAAMLLTCLIFTFMMMLSLGVGLGYNYCFVDFKTKHKYVRGHYRYQVLEKTTTGKRYPTRRPPYPTEYPPKDEWWRRANLMESARRQASLYSPGHNASDYEKLNVTLALSSFEIFNDTKKNDTDTSMYQKNSNFYENDEKSNETLDEDEAISVQPPVVEDGKTFSTSKSVLQVNGLELFALLSKLKSENKNYTLKIETD